jgi:hypothetical protein
MRTRRSLVCAAALAGSLALAIPQVAGAAAGHGGARHRQKHQKTKAVAECVQQRPTVALTPGTNGGGVVQYGIQVTNNDSDGCAATTFIVQDWMNGPAGDGHAEFYTGTENGDYTNNVWVTLNPGQNVGLKMQAFGAKSGVAYHGGVGAWDHRDMPGHSGSANFDGVVN